MAVYDFRCMKCDKMLEDIHLPITHTKGELPQCCGQAMSYHIGSPPSVHWKDYDLPSGGFIAHSIPGKPVVTSLKQNRDLMERHDLIDANDFGPPPTHLDQEREHQEALDAIDAITPTPEQEQRLKEDGLLDIVD